MRPLTIPDFVRNEQHTPDWFLNQIEAIHAAMSKLQSENPDVTVVIPAYNEEETILRTLSSLSKTNSIQKIEILVVDNNSSDSTGELIKKSGAKYLFEGNQGVKHARTAGLHAAKGKYILNADADSIYSPDWIDLMTLPLREEKIVCTYGRFAFFPEENTSRRFYFFYESVGDLYKRTIQKLKDEAMYVYGCSSGYRKEQGIMVGGYDHPVGSNEDGYLGLKLRERFGRLKRISDNKALVWTSDRRLNEEGGAPIAFVNRLKKAFS
ncbi:MAG: glycosyltransferase family 2 protein [Daejeonella sp.]|uniref:glycosyltransferase n=1 Tax=Daejeonella sp. TaxID=2805397 RepID=UPI003C73A94F